MRNLLKLMMVGLLCGLWLGCGGGPGKVELPKGTGSPSASSSPSGQTNAAANNAAANTAGPSKPLSSAARNARRNLPAAAVGGGGGSAQAAVPPSGGSASTGGADDTVSASTGPFTAETKANGLFPQIPGAGNESAGFGGALFPVVTNQVGGGTASSGGSGGGILGKALSLFGGSGAASAGSEMKPGINPEGDEMPEMMGRAVKQFSDLDKEDMAIQALYGHLLSDPSLVRTYPMKWYRGISQPRVLFRWGIGIVYMEPSGGLDGRHPVLGDPGGTGSAGGGSGNFDGGNAGLEGGDAPPPGAGGSTSSSERKYKNVNTARPDGIVLYYTGEMGEMVIDSLDKRRRTGDAYYGELLKSIPLLLPSQPTKQTASNSAGAPGMGGGGGGTANRGFGSSDARNARRNLPGAAVGGGGGGSSQPVQPPSGDPTFPSGSSAGGNESGSNAAAKSNAPKEAPAKVLARAMGSGESAKPEPNTTGTIVPGVMLVGVGKKAALVEKAKEMGLDALIVFNVTVSKTRSSGKVSSMTKMTILNLIDSDEEVVYSGKALKDTVVADQKEKGMTPVKTVVNAAFKSNADLKFKAEELPSALNSENVKRRVDSLVANPAGNPLPLALEVLNYHQDGLVDDQFAIESLNTIFGDDSVGSALVSSDPRVRVKAIAKWVMNGKSLDDDDDL